MQKIEAEIQAIQSDTHPPLLQALQDLKEEHTRQSMALDKSFEWTRVAIESMHSATLAQIQDQSKAQLKSLRKILNRSMEAQKYALYSSFSGYSCSPFSSAASGVSLPLPSVPSDQLIHEHNGLKQDYMEWVKVVERGGFPHSRVQGLSSQEIHDDLALIRHPSASEDRDQCSVSEEDGSESVSHPVDSSSLITLEASPLKDTLTLSSEASQPETLAMDEDDVFQESTKDSLTCNPISMAF